MMDHNLHPLYPPYHGMHSYWKDTPEREFDEWKRRQEDPDFPLFTADHKDPQIVEFNNAAMSHMSTFLCDLHNLLYAKNAAKHSAFSLMTILQSSAMSPCILSFIIRRTVLSEEEIRSILTSPHFEKEMLKYLIVQPEVRDHESLFQECLEHQHISHETLIYVLEHFVLPDTHITAILESPFSFYETLFHTILALHPLSTKTTSACLSHPLFTQEALRYVLDNPYLTSGSFRIIKNFLLTTLHTTPAHLIRKNRREVKKERS